MNARMYAVTPAVEAGWRSLLGHITQEARVPLTDVPSPAQRPALYAEMVGNLVTARNVLDAVREGRIDVGPLDAYWHMLIARHAPQLTAGTRVLTSTPMTPMPALVAAAAAPADMVTRLRAAVPRAAPRPRL